MDELGGTRPVTVANIILFRGAHGGDGPSRVWELPPELQSDMADSLTDTRPAGDVAVPMSADISTGWTT